MKKQIKIHRQFEPYVKIAKALSVFFGSNLEVIVHDYGQPDSSVIAAFNSHITGRKIGDKLTEIGKSRLSGKKIPDELLNYENRSPSGKLLKSASIAIRDERNHLIGSFCMNFDVSFYSQIENFIKSFTSMEPLPADQQPEFKPEKNHSSIESMLDSFIKKHHYDKSKLSSPQKKQLVLELKQEGVMQLRGSVEVLSKELNLTRASIYNYLKGGSNA